MSITVDHGTQFTSRALDEWAYQRGVKLDFTCPGKPTQNGHIDIVQRTATVGFKTYENGTGGKVYVGAGITALICGRLKLGIEVKQWKCAY